MSGRSWWWLAAPAAAVFLAFWLLPMIGLAWAGFSVRDGESAYLTVLTHSAYWRSLFNTVALSLGSTLITLVLSLPVGRFLAWRPVFPGRRLLMAMLVFPLAFPGVVVGFFIILMAGRQGIISAISRWLTGEPVVFAYGMGGLFLGYLYFSLPRTIGMISAAAQGIDPSLLEAGRSLGASPWRRFIDIELPALMPALTGAGAISFATSMGAFGTAFTLAAQIDVLPLTIYNEFTNYANIPVAAALSILLGAASWAVMYVAHAGARMGATA
ncbi:ABC transporter permease [Bordetella avium]|uniref:ABC transporter, permease protein n=1 Tax=Bordetella avium (strain 197N) TaxID=360910 RepID=Q2KTP5_BORA1|nr:ABC transporter permease [Bordetella avium]AZY50673.1 ABC transporter permease [Bordetella avium]AZY54071.1 ABC transporter permease [Bordetella avium]RIQ15158.1 ABC transporter permease subunit [Bordetella avium]RIQ20045.1 ABC transporter permease subunit [Bordetella avium]RIQ34625.1 ABC transporter permease subunit [Bordetella avium]